MPTQTFTGTSPYEPLFGYSRAIRRGPFIHVSGTTSVAPASADSPTIKVLHPDSAYQQTLTAFAEALRAVEGLGGKREDVVRVRMYVRDQEDTGEVGRGMKVAMHGEGASEETVKMGGFAATMIVGVGFVEREMRVEVEMEASVEEP